MQHVVNCSCLGSFPHNPKKAIINNCICPFPIKIGVPLRSFLRSEILIGVHFVLKNEFKRLRVSKIEKELKAVPHFGLKRSQK